MNRTRIHSISSRFFFPAHHLQSCSHACGASFVCPEYEMSPHKEFLLRNFRTRRRNPTQSRISFIGGSLFEDSQWSFLNHNESWLEFLFLRVRERERVQPIRSHLWPPWTHIVTIHSCLVDLLARVGLFCSPNDDEIICSRKEKKKKMMIFQKVF